MRDDGATYPEPPPQVVRLAERDYHDVTGQLDALIAGARAVRSQHTTDLSLFLHVYTTVRLADPGRAAALAAVAVLRLMDTPPGGPHTGTSP